MWVIGEQTMIMESCFRTFGYTRHCDLTAEWILLVLFPKTSMKVTLPFGNHGLEMPWVSLLLRMPHVSKELKPKDLCWAVDTILEMFFGGTGLSSIFLVVQTMTP